MQSFSFTVEQKDPQTKARAGKLSTPHGDILTPNFNPVGTQATVKSLTSQDLFDIGAQIVLANTYHLHLRPGEEVVKEMGGLGKFMNWSKPTMTDSGGYQVFSLGSAQEKGDKKKLSKFTEASSSWQANARPGSDEKTVGQPDSGQARMTDVIPVIEADRMRKQATQPIKPAVIDDTGVTFFSHLDGSEHRLTPQTSIQMQEAIGADLIVAFDDHESPLWDHAQTLESLERTNQWALESLSAHKRTDQLMYGVVHGGLFEDLRVESAKFTDKHFGAIAIGGSYTTKEKLYQVLDWTVPYFQEDKPRHLLGIGEVQDLFEGVARGMDFFDCVAPTRRGRHGSLYIAPESGGRKENGFTMQIVKSEFGNDTRPLDPTCSCMVCTNYSRAYIHHLFRAEELLAYRLGTYHNLYFIVHLMQSIREAIMNGEFTKLKSHWLQD